MMNERLPDILGESFQLVLMQEKSSIWQLSLPIKTLDNDNFEIYLRKTGKNVRFRNIIIIVPIQVIAT